jgi:hypothetical protein
MTRRRRRTAVPGVEQVEDRTAPANLTTFVFNLPADVANRGASLVVFGTDPATGGMDYLQESNGSPSYVPVSQSPTATVPEITLSSPVLPAGTNTNVIQIKVPIPSQSLKSGGAVIFVGRHAGLTITSGTIPAPTPQTNPNDIYAYFEMSYTSNTLDVDISDVDQVGLTYTVTSSNGAPYPLAKVGDTPDRSAFFNQYQGTFSSGDVAAQAFFECLQLGRDAGGNQLRLVAPQDLLSKYESSGPNIISAQPSSSGSGSLPSGIGYYYFITATSTITGGQTTVGSVAYGGANDNGVTLAWQPYTGIQSGATGAAFVTGSIYTTGYDVYRGIGPVPDGSGTHPPSLGQFQLIGQVQGAAANSYSDTGSSPLPALPPPSSSYGFDPLSTYFTLAIENFFNYYLVGHHTFVYDQDPQIQGDPAGTTWTGNTVTNYQPAAGGPVYTALALTPAAGGEFPTTDTVYIYEPLFSTNTNDMSLPAMPSWMSPPYLNETPSQMVFACDGAFASNANDPAYAGNANLQKALGNIENQIVSALNRGVATLPTNPPAAPITYLSPDQWVNPIQFSQDPSPGAGGSLNAGQTYYYVVTTVEPGGETVPTRDVAASLGSGQRSVTLSWGAQTLTVASSYKIYRGNAPGHETLIATIANDGSVTGFGDAGGQPPSAVTPPYQFYSDFLNPGSPGAQPSNLYSAFLHQNSTTNPQTGISVNGMVYGMPFDDNGNFSTNIEFPANVVPDTVTFDLDPFITTSALRLQVPATATVGMPFSVTVMAITSTGAIDPTYVGTVDFSASDPQAALPADYTFLPSDAGRHVFVVTLNTAGTQTLSVGDTINGLAATESIRVQFNSGSAVATTTALSVTPDPAVMGHAVAFTATVYSVGGLGSPTGFVTFTIDGVAQPPVPLVAGSGRAQASLVVNAVSAGSHTIIAIYHGDANDLPSISHAVLLGVNPAGGPTIGTVTRYGFHAHPTTLVIHFGGVLDPARANDVANYRIVGPNHRRIAIKSAVYNAATSTVRLAPVHQLDLHKTYLLMVNGITPHAIMDTGGVLLDGNGRGQPGSDYVTHLTAANLVLAAPFPGGPARMARIERAAARIAAQQLVALNRASVRQAARAAPASGGHVSLPEHRNSIRRPRPGMPPAPRVTISGR